MKRIIMALMLALALGCVAVAEDVTEPSAPAGQVQAADDASARAEDAGAAAEDVTASDENAVNDDAADDDALAEALEALHKARVERAQEELQAELDEYVAAGKLTQEQAGLLMKHFQNRRCNECPGGGCFGGKADGNKQDGNHIGGQKQYGNWQFGWSFDWHFPGQEDEDEDNAFRDMWGWNHM